MRHVIRRLRVPLLLAVTAGVANAKEPPSALVLPPLPIVAASPAPPPAMPPDLVSAQIDNETAQAAYYRAQVDKTGAPQTPAWLQTVLGGVLAIVGGAFSTLLTNQIADRKRRAEAHATYLRQKSQLRLSVEELFAALDRIPPLPAPVPAFLSEQLVYRKPVRPATADRSDPYYLKYDLVDTVYRFCALLGWLELYRTDPSFLRGPEAEKAELEKSFAGIRSSLAGALDDEKQAHPGVTHWRDGFVLEDDQRAIGEQMLSRRRLDTAASVIGYAAFCEQLFRDPDPDNPTDGADPQSQNWWVWNATRFFTEMGQSLPSIDLRRLRLARLVVDLKALLGTLA